MSVVVLRLRAPLRASSPQSRSSSQQHSCRLGAGQTCRVPGLAQPLPLQPASVYHRDPRVTYVHAPTWESPVLITVRHRNQPRKWPRGAGPMKWAGGGGLVPQEPPQLCHHSRALGSHRSWLRVPSIKAKLTKRPLSCLMLLGARDLYFLLEG